MGAAPDLLQSALRHAQRTSGVPVVFGGGLTRDGAAPLTHFLGTRTTSLRGLVIQPAAGLGGQALVSAEPAGVDDYGTDRTITRDYAGPVRREGFRSVFVAPVQVNGVTRVLLYGALREPLALGDRARALIVRAGRRLAAEIAVRDEGDRRLAEARQGVAAAVAGGAPRLELLRELHAELREIAGTVADPDTRDKLQAVAQRLAGIGSAPASTPVTALTGRELDVLAQVSLGCTNAETARRLGIHTETVKSYLGNAMAKLQAGSRYQAVVQARRLGVLP